MRSDAFARVVVGPIGSGKSSASCLEVLRRAAQQTPDADNVRRTRWAVIRNTYRQLKDTTRKTWEQWIPPELGAWNEQDFTFTIDTPLDDGTRIHAEVLFRALDRPQDVKKVLSLELTGAYLNEMREIPRTIFDGLGGRVGRYPAAKDGGASWFGIWGDTNPWHTGHWGFRLFSVAKPEGHALFEQPGGRGADAENVENLPPGYYQRLVHGKDAEWVDEYIDGKYPSADKGSVYGKQLALVDGRGGAADFRHQTDGIFTSWDLGLSDATAIWWWRISPGRGVDVLDYYEASGEPLSHFFGVLESRTWAPQYTKHWLPHDARARTLATGVSILDLFREKYGADKVAIGPSLSLVDGINAGRWLLEQPDTRFHGRCAAGVETLRAYRYEYDDDTKSYSKRPLHDFSSHTADAWRYLSLVARAVEGLTRPQPAVVSSDARRGISPGYTVDDFNDEAAAPRARRV